MKKFGVTDVPIAIEKEKDIFSVKSYIDGLENFIENCPTPMSIALQGDWGTGKTTFLKTIERDFKSKNIKVVYFNTWAYSQFNDLDGLYFSLINNIICQLNINDDEDIKKSVKEILYNIVKVTIFGIKTFAVKKICDTTGLEVEDIYKQLEGQVKELEDKSIAINALKNDFAKLVKDIVKKMGSENKARIVICIDDLDRLEPKRAVEVLEVLKLFMDVESCIYLLAIDYNVVVSGVRSKYDSNMSDEKCRAFFDKIIQLPFSMPVQKYNVNNLLKDFFEDNKSLSDSYQKIICEFVQSKLGSNPRTVKRFLNRCCLLDNILEATIEQGDRNEIYYSCLLLIITIQMYNEEDYMELLDKFSDGIESGKVWLDEDEKSDSKEVSNDASDENSTTLDDLKSTYTKVKRENEQKNSQDKDSLINIFYRILTLSVTTASIKEATYYIEMDGNIYKGEKQQSKSMVQLVERLFERVKEGVRYNLINENEKLCRWIKFDNDKTNGCFGTVHKTGSKFNINGESEGNICIGTYTNKTTKVKQVKDLIKILKEKKYIDENEKIDWYIEIDGERHSLLY